MADEKVPESEVPRGWGQNAKTMGGGDLRIVESGHLEVGFAISNTLRLAWIVSVESGVPEGEANDGKEDPEVEVLIPNRGAGLQMWIAMVGQRLRSGIFMDVFSLRKLGLASCTDAPLSTTSISIPARAFS